jgi:hypothetical protein
MNPLRVISPSISPNTILQKQPKKGATTILSSIIVRVLYDTIQKRFKKISFPLCLGETLRRAFFV